MFVIYQGYSFMGVPGFVHIMYETQNLEEAEQILFWLKHYTNDPGGYKIVVEE